MAEVILFADVVGLYTTYLREAFVARSVDVHVGTTIPNPRPETFLRVSRSGGVQRSVVIDDAQLTLEVWAPTEQDAQDLAQLVRSLIIATKGTQLDGTPVYAAGDLVGPNTGSGLLYEPDRYTDLPRYSFSMAVATRGRAE